MQAYLDQSGLFSEEEIAYFLSQSKTRLLAKNDFFIREGKVAKKFAWINSGFLRSFYYSSSSDEVTFCFSFPKGLIAGYSSLVTGEASAINIQALMDCELVEYPYSLMDELASNNPNWVFLGKQIAEMEYVKLEKRMFLFQKENAKIRYQELLENKYEYLQKIKLSHLASYLGISQRHLSRLRREVN